ncbi:uncharacterized protein BDR25DRAFT_377312 [Lindgomyces ingoldianus]|uniref:Uncharacterized protein n=1 Tax=Lindgomyces ingoldianus TaxID=673940 RepID=A0ACB6QI76_9PLEO|nr:uncharacterized protein BDR25DRAFT_377312 [Lindgomyces ingoldianus]KAF2466225.1 hypothetical protein BDR25DRAFT_377312 [Lindgomyces ingoldianus]
MQPPDANMEGTHTLQLFGNGNDPPRIPQRKPVAKTTTSIILPLTPNVFIATVLLGAAFSRLVFRWIVSGAPLLAYSILLGESNGYRILPYIPKWTIFSTLNLVYAVAATSWLLYWVFAAFCYPSILLSCLFQFDAAAGLARWMFRTFLIDLHFINDKIAFFDLPALEIDTEVDGLMVIRGATFSFTTLTLTAHGVEAGIKLSDDMELAIQVEKVTVSLFRRIELDHVFTNIKGGEFEMTFGTLAPDTQDRTGDPLMVSDTPILIAASAALDGTIPCPTRMKTAMAAGKPPKDSSNVRSAFELTRTISPDEENASAKYKEILGEIFETSTVEIARAALKNSCQDDESGTKLDFENANDMRAAICAEIHDQPSIPHPPSKSVRVSTLAKSPPWVKTFLHRLPLLLRVLLNPHSYFHPIRIKSITSAGSGKWMVHLMQTHFFRHYVTQDAEIRRLESRISSWLADANFTVELGKIDCTAHVPINTSFDIETHLKVGDFMAYRTLPEAVNLTQVISLGGLDATVSIPSYLLPHHEHILPEKPTEFQEMELEQAIRDAEGAPNIVKAEAALEQLHKDEANIRLSAHAHLPACFHQDLLNFVAATVKATKVIEMDRGFEEVKSLRELKRTGTNTSVSSEASSLMSIDGSDQDQEKKSFKSFMRKMDQGMKDAGVNMKDGMRKAGVNTVNAMANDRWIAKLVGKITRKLEKAQGDVGYSGNLPVKLEWYRARAEPDSKLLP